ncbi:MAG: glycosyltransferase [Clostridia bacterium]|nr:glycosyltransferase [Clostridia bacterium]
MKVLHINAVYHYGSTGMIVEDIHNLSLEKGIDSYVVYSTSSKSENRISNPYQMGKSFPKKLHALLSRINGRQGYFSKNSTKKLLNYLDKIKPDIVHLHNLHANYINLNMLLDYLAKKDISTVVTLHDCWFFTGGCYHYTNQGCYKWQEKCGNCPKKHTDLKSHFLDKTKENLADRKKHFSKIKDLNVVGVSNWISDEAQKSILKDKNHFVIHNGIDTELFVNTPSNLKEELGLENKFVVLGLAIKWLDPINKKAFDYVSQNLPTDCAFVLFGCTEEQKSNLPENVIGLDYIKDKDTLIKLYSMADVLINCTREETLSLINVEPQACGTPVITYKNTGAKETVDNICGFSVETEDYCALFEKIIEIKARGKSAYSSLCRSFVINNFDKASNYQRYIDLYESIFKEKQKNK